MTDQRRLDQTQFDMLVVCHSENSLYIDNANGNEHNTSI